MRANDLRTGMAINFEGRVCVITKTDHVKPGKGPAYVQMKAKDINTGSYVEKRLGSTEDVEVTTLDRREMEYLYSDSSGHVFMDTETYDQMALADEFAGDAMPFMRANTTVTILLHDDRPVLIEPPASVELEIQETAPGIKGSTVTNQLKEATCETGLKTRVPQFIKIGDIVKISTTDGSYMARVGG